MTRLEEIAAAWKIAAADLGFTFTPLFALEEGGRVIRYAGLVHDFGSEKGILIFTSQNFETEPWASVAAKNGFGYSLLGGVGSGYDRSSFISILDDWGWSPKDRVAPIWYTGKPWTE